MIRQIAGGLIAIASKQSTFHLAAVNLAWPALHLAVDDESKICKVQVLHPNSTQV